MKNTFLKNFILISFISILVTRLIPHPPNFTPILAAALFAGFYFKNFILGSFVIIFSMFIGDLYFGLHNTMIFVYISLAACVILGTYFKNLGFKEIFIGALTSSIFFYLVTNFGSWLLLDMYEKNLSGLLHSYILAIPFFQNTFLSTLFYLMLIKILFYIFKKKIINT